MRLDPTPLEQSLVQLEENLALFDSGMAAGNPALRRALERGAGMAAFIGDATSVYETMTQTQWEK